MSRDILSPPIQRIGKRCFRVNYSSNFSGNEKEQNSQGYIEEDLYCEDDDIIETYEIEELPNGMFKTSLHLAQPFYAKIIGHKGSTKRRIESESQTEVYIPRPREIADVTIKGKSRKNVCSARRKIELIAASMRKRMKSTHFTCVPTCNGEIKEKFNKLKEKILSDEYPDIEEKAFQSSDRIHITLGLCVLLDEVDRNAAVELLHSCNKFLKEITTPIEIKIHGLEIMNDDPSAVRVLYACVESPDLEKFRSQVNRVFIESGLGIEDSKNMKLHMTIINNKYRKMEEPQCPKTFNACEILKKYGNYDFGKMQATEVHLSVMSRLCPVKNEFYKSTGILKL